MKRRSIAWLVVISLAFLRNASGQGFVNLNFEDAQIIPIAGSPIYPYAIATTNALLGWTVYTGASQPAQVITYNAPALGSTWVNLWATNGQQIDGNFSVLLQGGITASSASISQTGLIPVSTKSLLFEAQSGPGVVAGSLVVSLGGQIISFSAISTGPNYILYGGDISTFAGLTEQLTFSALEGGGNNWNIDDIQFSPSSVPEPTTLGLIALGALLFGLRRSNEFRICHHPR